MQLKKIFMTLLVVVIAISTLTFAASAATPSIDFAVSVEGTADADGRVVFEPGDIVDVVIDVHNNPGIALLEINLKYNSAVFAPVDANEDGTFDKEDCTAGAFLDAETYVFDANDGVISFKTSLAGAPTPIVDEEGNIIKDGEIVRLSFEVLENAHTKETTLSLSKAIAIVVNGAAMQQATVNATNAKLAVHDIVETEGKEATCFEEGATASAKCNKCDYGVASEVIPALNHEGFLEVIPAKPGNCTSPAVSAGEKCTKCGTVTVEPVTGDSVAHTPNGTWEVVEPATHLKPGKQQQKCVNCGEVALEAVVPQILAHNWVQKGEPVAPTCLDAGYTIFECECGETKHDALVAALGHAWGEGVVTTAPTCTALGEKTYTCSACKETKTENVAMAAHDYVVNVVAPTCTTAGYTAHDCKNCDAYYEDTVVAAKGHTYTEAGKVDATCTKPGEITYACACGVKYTVATELKAHDFKETGKVAATCNKPGEITYACACGVKYTTNTELAKHEYQSEITKAATCTASGVKTNTCKVCGDVYVETVDMIAHTFTDAVTAPTCTTMGYTTHTCSACEYKVVDTFVDAKGHTLVVDEAVNPTATAEGKTQGLHCSECDLVHLAQTTVPALGLTWLWVMIAVVVIVAGACVGLYFICKKSFGK